MLTGRDLKIIEEVRDTDEPIIIFRAQDVFTVKLIEAYITMHEMIPPEPSVEFQKDLVKRFIEFQAWQDKNPDKVKRAD